MSRKFTLLLLLIASGGLGWTLYRKVVHPAETASPAVSNKPSPAGAPVAAVQSGATLSATTVPASASDAHASDADAASSFVAMRLDNTHIYVAFSSPGSSSDDIDRADWATGLTKLGEGPKFGAGPVFQASDEILAKYQRLFQRVRTGEEWELDLSPETRVRAVVSAPVVVQGGCFAAAGFTAQIVESDQPSFAAAGKDYFLLHKPYTALAPVSDPKSEPIGELPDWKATSDFRAALEKLLKSHLQQELPELGARYLQGYKLAVERDAENKTVLMPWSIIEGKLVRGEVKLDYTAQAFRLTPDGTPRIYIHAHWTIDANPVFLTNAWLRAEANPAIEAVKPLEVQLIRSDGKRSEQEYPENDFKILNVLDRMHNHHGQLLIFTNSYAGESFDIMLHDYNAGPVRTKVSVGGGC